jgi:hypothetical protein
VHGNAFTPPHPPTVTSCRSGQPHGLDMLHLVPATRLFLVWVYSALPSLGQNIIRYQRCPARSTNSRCPTPDAPPSCKINPCNLCPTHSAPLSCKINPCSFALLTMHPHPPPHKRP